MSNGKNKSKHRCIGSKPQREGEHVFKGYSRSQFEDAWKRYVPVHDVKLLTAVSSSCSVEPPPVQGIFAVTSVTSGTSEPAVTGVTASKPPSRVCGCGEELASDNTTGICGECVYCARQEAIAKAQAQI